MSPTRDKKIIDRYLAKHPNATPEKIETYAKEHGIYIDVMSELEYRKLKETMNKDLDLPNDFELNSEENQKLFQQKFDNLSDEKKSKYQKLIK
jgi:hypothetical protein